MGFEPLYRGVGLEQLLLRYTIRCGDNLRSTHEASFMLDLSDLKASCVVCDRSIRKLKKVNSINVYTAIAEYASTSGSVKRVRRCVSFHQACTPVVHEAFLVDLVSIYQRHERVMSAPIPRTIPILL